jgi:two-component system response regulator FixJ
MAIVIESDDAVRDSLEALIRAQGHSCRAFADAASFLADQDSASGNFVIVDEALPANGCLAVLRELSVRDSGPAVIVVTTRVDAQSGKRLRRAGADAVLVSPFSESDLTTAIRAALASRNRPAAETCAP